MNRRTFALTAGLLLVATGVASAGNPDARGPRGHRGPPPIEHLTELLDLSDEQAAALATHHQEQHEAARELHDALHAQHEALRAAMEDGTTDEDDLHALVDQIGALRLELDHHRLDGQLATRALLTPEQRERLDELGPPPGAHHRGPPPGHRRGPPPDCAPPE